MAPIKPCRGGPRCSALSSAIATARCAVKLLEPLMRERLRVVDGTAGPRVIVLDEGGEETTQTVEQLVAEFRKSPATAQAFEPLPTPPKKAALNGHTLDPSKLSASEKIQAIRAGLLPPSAKGAH